MGASEASFPAARSAAALILVAATATIAGALASQYGFGLVPCKLCLWQRWPYYAGVPVALLTVLAPAGRSGLRRAGLVALLVIFVVSTGLGTYHAGVEWHWWPGPADCAGGTGTAPASVGGLLASIERSTVVRCDEAAWRMLGLSLAGWNGLVSILLAALAGWAAFRGSPGRTRQA